MPLLSAASAENGTEAATTTTTTNDFRFERICFGAPTD